MNIFHNGPSESDPPPPDSDEADPYVNPYDLELTPEEQEALADPDMPPGSLPKRVLLESGTLKEYTFRGPALSVDLPDDTNGDTLLAIGPRGNVEVVLNGRTVRRPSGHFGKGRWTVTYNPL